MGKYENAASVLFRRSDMETLKLAVELAEKSGNEELHKLVLFRYSECKNESGVEVVEKKLPSKVDVVLKHLENEYENKEEIFEELDFCKSVNGVMGDIQNEGKNSSTIEIGITEERGEEPLSKENVKEILQEVVTDIIQ